MDKDKTLAEEALRDDKFKVPKHYKYIFFHPLGERLMSIGSKCLFCKLGYVTNIQW